MDVMIAIENPEAKMIEMDRLTISLGTVRLKILTSRPPFKRFHSNMMRMAALVVFTPPPVEPGEAPMNISTRIRRRVAFVKDPISTVLNPAVRGVTDWNNEAKILFKTGTSLIMWFLSKMKNRIPPERMRVVVMMITIGTGLGSALFVDGRLVPNTELGHIEIDCDDAETLASDVARKEHDLSWKKWAKRLDKYLGRLESLFSPDLMILGGGAIKNQTQFLPLLTLRTRIIPAQMGNDAGIVGAALAARRNLG